MEHGRTHRVAQEALARLTLLHVPLQFPLGVEELLPHKHLEREKEGRE